MPFWLCCTSTSTINWVFHKFLFLVLGYVSLTEDLCENQQKKKSWRIWYSDLLANKKNLIPCLMLRPFTCKCCSQCCLFLIVNLLASHHLLDIWGFICLWDFIKWILFIIQSYLCCFPSAWSCLHTHSCSYGYDNPRPEVLVSIWNKWSVLTHFWITVYN